MDTCIYVPEAGNVMSCSCTSFISRVVKVFCLEAILSVCGMQMVDTAQEEAGGYRCQEGRGTSSSGAAGGRQEGEEGFHDPVSTRFQKLLVITIEISYGSTWLHLSAFSGRGRRNSDSCCVKRLPRS